VVADLAAELVAAPLDLDVLAELVAIELVAAVVRIEALVAAVVAEHVTGVPSSTRPRAVAADVAAELGAAPRRARRAGRHRAGGGGGRADLVVAKHAPPKRWSPIAAAAALAPRARPSGRSPRHPIHRPGCSHPRVSLLWHYRRVVATRIISDLMAFGASREQLVDLSSDDNPRTLQYADLARSPDRSSVVFEVQGQPRAYVFSANGKDVVADLPRWIRRVAFRGDADWVGVLHPGRLDVFRAALDGNQKPRQLTTLPQGPLLFPALVHQRQPDNVPSVRAALLTLLRRSIDSALAGGVETEDALPLVGRALFWRFLIDRKLLDGLDPDQVSRGAATWESCLDNKQAALKTFEWLDQTFNGGFLPFSSRTAATRISAEVYRTTVGNIAYAATADGQLPLRLPAEWREVNFGHVPVGLLSEVYESFAHDAYKERANAESVFYTPRQIAAFVVDESLAALGNVDRPRVLDPAAGAGVFLVTVFRALVEREWERTKQKPTRKTVRRILNAQLTGFDINDDALRLAELALYLTAIELDPDARPRPLSLLRFETLRGKVLHLLPGGKGEGSLAPVPPEFRKTFDLVLGNPPWNAHDSKSAKVWAETTRPRVRELLGQDRAADFVFPDANPDLPFVYRATEWLVDGGSIALAMPARWLFLQTKDAVAARRDLFEAIHITGILNGTSLRDSRVWPNMRHAFCLLFATNERPPAQASVQFISPELEQTPDRLQRHLRIDWTSARDVAIQEIVDRPWTLKMRFRGTSFDESVLEQVLATGRPLGEYLHSLGTGLKNGYKVGGPTARKRPVQGMDSLRDLRGKDLEFQLEARSLPYFSERELERPRNAGIYAPPLLLVHESMRVDHTHARAGLAFVGVAFDQRFDGVSFADILDGENIAAYLQLVIQSNLFAHSMLFLDGQFGVEREVVVKDTIERMPVVPWPELAGEHRQRAKSLSVRLRRETSKEIFSEIDELIADTFALSDVQRTTIRDTLATALPTAPAKKSAARGTEQAERARFARTCERELSELLGESVVIRPLDGIDGPWRFLQIDNVQGLRRTLPRVEIDPSQLVAVSDDASVSLITIRESKRTVVVGQLDQYRYWTSTRARMLASSLAESDGDD